MYCLMSPRYIEAICIGLLTVVGVWASSGSNILSYLFFVTRLVYIYPQNTFDMDNDVTVHDTPSHILHVFAA